MSSRTPTTAANRSSAFNHPQYRQQQQQPQKRRQTPPSRTSSASGRGGAALASRISNANTSTKPVSQSQKQQQNTSAAASAPGSFKFEVEGENEYDENNNQTAHSGGDGGAGSARRTANQRQHLDGEEPRFAPAVFQYLQTNNDNPHLFSCYVTRWLPPQQKASYISSLGNTNSHNAAAFQKSKSRSQTCHVLSRGPQCAFVVGQKNIYLMPKESWPLSGIAEVVVHHGCGTSANGPGAVLEFRMLSSAALLAAAFGPSVSSSSSSSSNNVRADDESTTFGLDPEAVQERRNKLKQQQLLEGGIAPAVFSRYLSFGGDYIVARVTSILRIVAPDLQLTVHVSAWPPSHPLSGSADSPLRDDIMWDVPDESTAAAAAAAASAKNSTPKPRHLAGNVPAPTKPHATSTAAGAGAAPSKSEQELAAALKQGAISSLKREQPQQRARAATTTRGAAGHQPNVSAGSAHAAAAASSTPSGAAGAGWTKLKESHGKAQALTMERLHKWDDTVRGAVELDQQQNRNLHGAGGGGQEDFIAHRQNVLSRERLPERLYPQQDDANAHEPRAGHLFDVYSEGITNTLTSLSKEVDSFLDKFSVQHEAGNYLKNL